MRFFHKKISLLILCLLIITSCNKDLDINENPNLPTQVDKAFVLSSAQASISTVLGGFLTNYGGFMAQYHTQSPGASQYLNIEAYSVPQNFTNRFWVETFVGGINNLDFVIKQSDIEGDNASYLIAKLLRVYIYQVLTDLYGDIPYSEKLQGTSNLNPSVVSQKEIYEGLLTAINDAVDRYTINPNSLKKRTQDVILEGDMQEWLKFANTLKLKILLRLSSTSLSDKEEVIRLLLEDNFITQDINFDIYEDVTNKRNPFSDVQLNELGGVNHTASNSLLMFYKNNNDPRISEIYKLVNGNTEYLGLDQGAYDNSLKNQLSKLNFSPTKPVYFITLSESNFLQAEALERYMDGIGAKLKYEDGVKFSFIDNGLDTTDADILLGDNYKYIENASSDENIRQIIIQKWVSLAYKNNIEAYFEQLRTGYPEIIAKTGSPNYTIGNLKVSLMSRLVNEALIPQTLWYPDIEVDSNKNLTQKANLELKNWWAN